MTPVPSLVEQLIAKWRARERREHQRGNDLDHISDSQSYAYGLEHAFGTCADELEALLASLPQQERRTAEWQPIETAPKVEGPGRGPSVLLWNGRYVQCGFFGCSVNHAVWRGESWQMLSPQPTHWMPLPDPPISYEALGVLEADRV